MVKFKQWFEAYNIAGAAFKTRDEGANWVEIKAQIDRLIDIIVDPKTTPEDKDQAKKLAADFASQIKRSGLLKQPSEPESTPPAPITSAVPAAVRGRDDMTGASPS